jgi:hypothetical protein
MPEAHWLFALQASPLATTQVLVVVAQVPLAQTGVSLEDAHVPLWMPSLGMACPAASLAAHVRVVPSQ